MTESEYLRLMISQKPNDYPEIKILLEFERCCTFLAEMMGKYACVVMRDIITAIKYDPETSSYDAKGKKLRYLTYAKRFQEKLDEAA